MNNNVLSFCVFIFCAYYNTTKSQNSLKAEHDYYTYFCKFSLEEKSDSSFYYFQKWIMDEQDLDSLQRVFIATDLSNIRNTNYWKIIEDSLMSIFIRTYPSIKEKEIGFELWQLGAEDQKTRTLSRFYNVTFPRPEDPNFEEHRNNFRKARIAREDRIMQLIYEQDNWLGFNLVGYHGSKAAFLIIQHTDNNKLRKKCLPLLRKAVENNDADPYHYAMMKDRYMLWVGRNSIWKKPKQLYGTQLKPIKQYWKEDKHIVEGWMLLPIKDERNVNKRRAKLGLKPLEVELKERWGIDYPL